MKTTNYTVYVAANSDSIWTNQGVTIDLDEAKLGARCCMVLSLLT